MNNAIFEIGRLDENGVLVGIEHCSVEDYAADPIKRTVPLEPGHDMRNHIGNYRWDWHQNTFKPLSQEPLEAAERDTAELVEGIIETIEDMADHLKRIQPQRRTLGGAAVPDEGFKLPRRMERVLKDYRRDRPRRREGVE